MSAAGSFATLAAYRAAVSASPRRDDSQGVYPRHTRYPQVVS
jgi:hypothetical protein